MIERAISEKIRISARQVPVVTVLGPRQAGKTTLVRDLFPDYTYVNLEDRVTRELAENDYIGFFSKYPEPMIIDEVQRVPELLSAIQVKVDEELVFHNIPADITEINKHLINSINKIGTLHKKELMSREVGLDIIERNS